MEDIVGIKVRAGDGRAFGFMTWGRIFDVIDETELMDTIKQFAKRCQGTQDIASMELCRSLQGVSKAVYFYEALSEYSRQRIPSGKKYKA